MGHDSFFNQSSSIVNNKTLGDAFTNLPCFSSVVAKEN